MHRSVIILGFICGAAVSSLTSARGARATIGFKERIQQGRLRNACTDWHRERRCRTGRAQPAPAAVLAPSDPAS
ncbi:MAG: hypothetical protein U1E76_18795 [Planctomycetota bacterium]